MKFTENGPTIPDDLLIARDAGDVVFFCGAGVSMAYAGLPNFFTLSDNVLNALGAGWKSTASQLLDQARKIRTIGGVGGLIPADRIFSLLEREFEISDIRDEVIKSVRPTGLPALDAHKILLDLSTSRNGKVRLVTTNFDLLFEASNSELASFGPPDFIDPKADNFGGIIHLHGRAADDYNGPRASEEFVVSSADFGRAYLADGWATQFMRALLERFVVVFVGYTADDPPVRYLLEALNTHPGGRSQLYAFQSGTDQDTLAMWEHRGVRAIGYDTTNDHAALWDTLAAWAERARNLDGWHDQLLQQAAQGPDKVSAHIRGQIAHLMSTPDGARRIAATDPPLPASWLLVADPRQRYRNPEHEEFGNKDSLEFDPFEPLHLDTDAPPKAKDSDNPFSYTDREIPPDAWDGFANNNHDIGTIAGFLRGHNTAGPADLSPRLRHLSVWLSKIAHDPIALWWSAQQKNGLHPWVVERIKNRLLHDRENAFSEEISREWRLLIEAWSDRRPDSDMTAVLLDRQTKREGWSTRLVREYAALFYPRIEIDTGGWWRLGHPLLWTTDTCVERIVYARVAYPHPNKEADIPKELVSYAARMFRAILELSDGLEREIGQNELYITTTYVDKRGGGGRHTDTYGVAGLISYFLQLMEQFERIDPDCAKAEIRYWHGYDNRIFARLRLWAATSDLTTGTEAADILMKLPDDTFWYSQDSPDVLHAIVSSWPKLDVLERRQIEQRLLTTCFPWSGDIQEPQGYTAYRRLEYLHALSIAGVEFSFDLATLTEELCKLAPDWHPDAAEDAMASNAPKVRSVVENTDYGPLLDIPVSRILTVATEIAGQHPLSRWESASFKGLSENKPVRAISALRHAAKQGSVEEWAWRNFLSCPRRASDSHKIAKSIGQILCSLKSKELASIDYLVANWLCLLKTRLYGNLAEILDPLWDALLSALRGELSDETTHGDGWGDVALNSPVGRLVEILFADPLLSNPADGIGLPDTWKQRADQLLSLPGGLCCQALVMLSHHIVFLYARDSHWVDAKLVPFANSLDEAANALWEGLVWGARVPSPDLFRQLKPSLLVQASVQTREGQRAENIGGLLFYGWAFKADDASGVTLISDKEFRNALIDANDDVRRGVLHHLKGWQEQNTDQWHDLVLSFFQNVWPRQRALKTIPLSKALLRFALSSGELFPKIVSLLKSRVVPLRDGNGWLFDFNAAEESSPAKRYPRESLELLFTVLPDDASQWWFEIEDILPVLENCSDTRGDPRLSEIRRRLAR